jgi:uncharacterized oligopeptide transporter (OPT) family protein
MTGWLLKALMLRLTSTRRILTLFGLLLILSRDNDGDNNKVIFGSLLLLTGARATEPRCPNIVFFLTDGNVATSIILGVAVSIGIGQCADMMSDLKAGHLVGARPRLQQLAQLSFSWIGVPVAIGVLYLLWNGPGFGPDNPDLSAPQGAALAAVMEGLSAGAAPVDKYLAGLGVGLAMGIFPISGMGVLVGLAMYLPFYITLTYGVGCFSAIALERVKGASWLSSTVVPVAAGFIIGEALINLALTLVTLAAG